MVGFNDTQGNYWLGNNLLSQLTLSRRYRLRFDLQARGDLTWYYAEYSSFNVSGGTSNYQLHVSGYSGNAGDAFSRQNGMMFTTYDRDNDLRYHYYYGDNCNCAVRFGGGFWYKDCAWCPVNAPCNSFQWSVGHRRFSLQSSRMWLLC